jgi:hypothetical protein
LREVWIDLKDLCTIHSSTAYVVEPYHCEEGIAVNRTNMEKRLPGNGIERGVV